MTAEPIKLTLYDHDAEPVKTFSQAFVPWGIMKAALRLQHLDQANLTPEDVDLVNALVVDFYGKQFSVDELEAGATFDEVFAVLMAIMSRVEAVTGPNPTIPGRK